MIADCTQQRQQQEQGRLDRLKQQMTAGKLPAAIRESLDAALIQLNCPINMLAAARRLNGEGSGNVALEAARREGKRRWRGSSAVAHRWNSKAPAVWPLQPFFDDLCALYRTRFDPDGLQVDMASTASDRLWPAHPAAGVLKPVARPHPGPRRRIALRAAGDAALRRGERRAGCRCT
ncbi:hypothetical protein LNO81_19470 [Klebsiella variicola subsp. variicola]|nr:hypothetical protein [Klebsiella variicola subsp. variicola]